MSFLLPGFLSRTYACLDACPQRQVGAEFTVPLVLTADDQNRDCSSAVRSLALFRRLLRPTLLLIRWMRLQLRRDRLRLQLPILFLRCHRRQQNTLLLRTNRLLALPGPVQLP